MKTWHVLLLLVSLVLGVISGLAYGWLIDPVEYMDTGTDSLRIDYQTDIVLMIADIYAKDQDFQAAIHRLSFLGRFDTSQLLVDSLAYAEQMHFSPTDVANISKLNEAIQLTMNQDTLQP
jgi:GTP cyclohydrolase III